MHVNQKDASSLLEVEAHLPFNLDFSMVYDLIEVTPKLIVTWI